jgi:hypothetical protein
VLIVRAMKKLLQRVGPPTSREGEYSTTLLGQWPVAVAVRWHCDRETSTRTSA